MMTKRGIYPNILDSEYPFTVGEITFYFSSMVYRQKFMNLYRDEIKHINETAIRHKHPFKTDMTIFSLLRLYCLIEKRGFYIKVRGEEVTCLENVKMVLEISVRKTLTV
jgi:hypothetical protein